ncbi:carboxypeptidase regulatory-like domain-containing protein [Planosporangium sp. 12N6]|uniref:carboxypeptidase regulatory-like domain-containing protein n=1 Tax=Planosporangium spinosum TaxID=3402278 RepID=UPI003CED4682
MGRRANRTGRIAAVVAVVAAVGFTGIAVAVPAQAAPVPAGAQAQTGIQRQADLRQPAGIQQPAGIGHRTGIQQQAGTGSPGKQVGPVRPLCGAPKTATEIRCLALARLDVQGGTGIRPQVTPGGYGPADLRSAYALPSAPAGAGRTVAIVDAFDNPNVEADLAVYRAQYGLPACTTANGCFRKVNQNGQVAPLPAPEAGWAGEISLDVQMVSAICPSCDILLVEADSNADDDLYAAVNKAVELGAAFVSNSWGGAEYATQTADDETYFNHPGVVITAASGDDGYGALYPASSAYVTSVGGTSLARTDGGRGWTETVWSGAGSGCSAYEAKPVFQADPDCARRSSADVAAVADPATGVAVYNTYRSPGWVVYGGTSASAPIIASVYALAGTPPMGTRPNAFPYASPSALNDVTSGANGSCGGSYLCAAVPGYDGPTGLGTPNGVRAFAPATPYGTVTGRVTDAGDGHPLAGVRVEAGTAADTTGADGRYELGLPVGRYDVTASAYGYGRRTNSGVTVTEGTTTISDFTLAAVPRTSVSGTIRDGSGHGWPLYATVTVAGVPGGPVFTDPTTGRFSLDLPTGDTYTLHVAANYPGYRTVDLTVPVGTGAVTRDVSVPVDAAACAAPGYAVRHYGAFESFDADTTPPGWTVVDHTADGGWRFTDLGDRGNLTGGTGGFAMIDSDKLGVGRHQDTELRSPVVDLTGQSAPVISFNSDYRAWNSSVADVDLSLDAGETWRNVLHQTDSARGPRLVELPIPQAAGKAGVQVRFHYTGTFAYWWEVDDALVGTRACEPVPGGLLVGRVTDHNTAKGVNGATVTSGDHPADTARSAAAPGDASLGDGFYWMFSHVTGGHPVTASRTGYTDQTKTVTIAADWATRADFALEAGHLTVTPGAVAKSVKLGEQTTAKVTVRNDGTRPAQVRLTERDGGFAMLTRQGGGAPEQTVAGRFSPRRLVSGAGSAAGSTVAAEAGAAAAGAAAVRPAASPSAAPWTDIADLPIPIMDNAVGVSDGKLYSFGGATTDSIVGTSVVFDPAAGAWTRIAGLRTAREKPAGAFIGGRFYVVGGWAVDGDPEPSLEIYDPASNTWSAGAPVPTAFAAAAAAVLDGKLYVVGGCDGSVCGTRQVYAYTPASNTWARVADYPMPIAWSACGGLAGQVYCAGGTDDTADTTKGYSYNPATNAWSPIADLPLDLWAGSYATANGVLLISGGVTNGASTVTNRGVAYDPATDSWTAIANSNNTVYRGGAACGFYKVGGSVGNFNPVARAEVLPGLDQCAAATDVSWLSESPASFTLAPGKSTTVTVTLDGSVSQPGTYAARLAFVTDTPYPVAPVDVTMTVTPPKTWGKITGTVVGAACDGGTVPLAGATVQIDTWAAHYTLRTDADGRYALWLDKRNNPLDVIVARDGWQPKYRQVKIAAGTTTTVDWTLSCAP